MKKRILYSIMGVASLLFAACEDDITPSIDITPEYDYLLELTPNSVHADTVISEIYQKYEVAILYKFEEKDFRWLWADQINYYYEPLDISLQEDSIALENMIRYIETALIEGKDEATLRKTLPYKMFLTKEMHSGSSKDDDYSNVVYNGQDAILIGYMSSATEAYDEAIFISGLGTVYNTLMYNALDPKPTDFINSREASSLNLSGGGLVTSPANEAIETEPEWETYPEFLLEELGGAVVTNPYGYYHMGNVMGYIYTYGTKPGTATLYLPDEATDFADYYAFITGNPGSYIRERTQYYWRIAKRATLLIEYYQEYQGEDLIATQNANFPDDPVTMDDFAYVDRY